MREMLEHNVQAISVLIRQLLDRIPLGELSDAVIFGSSAVTLNGRDLKRKVDDLDLFVSDHAYEQLKSRAEEVQKKPAVMVLHIPGVEKVEILKTFPGVSHGEVA